MACLRKSQPAESATAIVHRRHTSSLPPDTLLRAPQRPKVPLERLPLTLFILTIRYPQYWGIKADGDAEQLTDGIYTEGYFWAQTSTVAYQEKTPSIVTLDLGDDL